MQPPTPSCAFGGHLIEHHRKSWTYKLLVEHTWTVRVGEVEGVRCIEGIVVTIGVELIDYQLDLVTAKEAAPSPVGSRRDLLGDREDVARLRVCSVVIEKREGPA